MCTYHFGASWVLQAMFVHLNKPYNVHRGFVRIIESDYNSEKRPTRCRCPYSNKTYSMFPSSLDFNHMQGNSCDNDPYFYQGCPGSIIHFTRLDAKKMKYLCGNMEILCSSPIQIITGYQVKKMDGFCNGITSCDNTIEDENISTCKSIRTMFTCQVTQDLIPGSWSVIAQGVVMKAIAMASRTALGAFQGTYLHLLIQFSSVTTTRIVMTDKMKTIVSCRQVKTHLRN